MFTAYQNKYNIDLESFHTLQRSNENLLNDLKIINQNKIFFNDRLSSSFKVVEDNGLLFLKGENSIYPCSAIVQSVYEILWTQAFIIPTGHPIKCTSDIRESSVIVFRPDTSLYNQIDHIKFDEFINDMKLSFENTNWFNRATIRQIITSYAKIDTKEKLLKLKLNHLLTPFELSLSSIIFNFNLNSTDVLSAINLSRNVRPDLPFVKYLNKTLSIAKSTSEIISSNEFVEFIDALNQKEIESFFEIPFLRDSLNLKQLYEHFIDDVLGINIHKRLYNYNEFNVSKTLSSRIEKMNINEDILNEFHLRLQSNLRAIENKIRTYKGFDIVGSLYKETLLYQKLLELYPNYRIIRQYSPHWLINQRFDIFFEDLNLAIEYNGRQHYEPIDFFGGVSGLIENQHRDERKRKACSINNCMLVEIRFDENFELALQKIKVAIDSSSKKAL